MEVQAEAEGMVDEYYQPIQTVILACRYRHAGFQTDRVFRLQRHSPMIRWAFEVERYLRSLVVMLRLVELLVSQVVQLLLHWYAAPKLVPPSVMPGNVALPLQSP